VKLLLYLSRRGRAHLEAVALSESQVADVTLVRFLSRVDSEVTLEFVRVGAGIRAVRTLVRTLTYTHADTLTTHPASVTLVGLVS